MSRKRIKQYLMLLTVVGLIAVAANGSGTFASFNAEVDNAGNTFATGSLLLNEQLTGDVTGTGTCDSQTATSNTNSTCTTAISLTNVKPGATASTDTFTLMNSGTIAAAGGLSLASTGCTNGTVGTSLGFNTGDLCGAIHMYAELDDSTGAAVSCLYGPAGTGNACDPALTSNTYTLKDFASTYLTANPTVVSSIPAATTQGSANGDGSNVYKVKIGLYLPNGSAGADNPYQNRTATFPLSWTLTQ
jgi:hypothetical protein